MIEAVRRLARELPLAAADRSRRGPRPDAVGTRRPGSDPATTGSSGCWSRRSRASTSPRSCSGRRARSGACSSPSTTAARRCSPRTRSSRRPTPGAGRLRRGPPRHRRVGHREDRLGVRREPPAGRELRRPPGLGPRPGARGPRVARRVPTASPSASTPGARTLASRPRTRSPGRPTPGSPLRWYLLRDGFLSYRAFLDRPKSLPASYRLLPEDRDRTTAFDREIPASFFAFDALRSFDLPQLLATSEARG